MNHDKLQLNQLVTIHTLKYDRSIGRSWTAHLKRITDSMIELVGEFEFEIVHPKLGVIGPGTISYEYYWFDRWYNVFRFHNADGSFRNYYCNVNMPPNLRDGILDYVDLDIDVLVWNDLSFEILDVDEFEENADRFGYPDEVRALAVQSVDQLTTLIENRHFPFDHPTDG
jgi:uncharacterized protein